MIIGNQPCGRPLSHGGHCMVARFPLIAGVASLLIAGPVFASPALASTVAPAGHDPGGPTRAERIAATTATFNAIEAKIAAGQSLRQRFPDPTASADLIPHPPPGLRPTRPAGHAA